MPPKSSTRKAKCWPAAAASSLLLIPKKCSRNSSTGKRPWFAKTKSPTPIRRTGPEKRNQFYLTTNAALLVTAPLDLVTEILPVVAPVGTVVVINVADATVKVAGVPLKLTAVAPVNPLPRIKTRAPTLPVAGSGETKARCPAVRLHNVPSDEVPPPAVVP